MTGRACRAIRLGGEPLCLLLCPTFLRRAIEDAELAWFYRTRRPDSALSIELTIERTHTMPVPYMTPLLATSHPLVCTPRTVYLLQKVSSPAQVLAS
jgi:hypothetical protein